MTHDTIRRREFLKNTIVLGATLGLPFEGQVRIRSEKPLHISIFSKHLQFLNLPNMVEAAAEMGFDGVDLAVRPKGHVEPAQVAEQLPEAVAAFRKVGFKPSLMTCSVQDAENETDRNVLATAARMGFRYYRMNYFHYLKDKSIPESLAVAREKIKKLAGLNEKLRITGCYQNHAGNYIGSSVWELHYLLSATESGFLGTQFDIRHAVVEGGLNWPNALKLVQDRIATLAIKDFRWEKVNGKWKVVDCPVGEGMVDFTAFFKLLKSYNHDVPVSLHYEYDLGGANNGSPKITMEPKAVFAAMRRDLLKVRELWEQA